MQYISVFSYSSGCVHDQTRIDTTQFSQIKVRKPVQSLHTQSQSIIATGHYACIQALEVVGDKVHQLKQALVNSLRSLYEPIRSYACTY